MIVIVGVERPAARAFVRHILRSDVSRKERKIFVTGLLTSHANDDARRSVAPVTPMQLTLHSGHGLSDDTLRAYLADPGLERMELAKGTEGRPIEDIIGCATHPGTVVADFTIGERADPSSAPGDFKLTLGYTCGDLGLGVAEYRPAAARGANNTYIDGEALPEEAYVALVGDSPAAHLATMQSLARAVRELHPDKCTVEKKRCTCLVRGAGFNVFSFVRCHGYGRHRGLELVAASARNDLAEVMKLLHGGVDPRCARDHLPPNGAGSGWTALHFAARLGHMEIVIELLTHGADPNATDHHGTTPVYEAACGPNDDDEVMRALIDAGGDVKRAPNAGEGNSALDEAASAGHVDVVKVLLGAGAPVNFANKKGATALCGAAEYGNLVGMRNRL